MWAVTNQRCTLHRRGHFALFNEIGFACCKHKLPGSDINLTAAEIDRKDAAFHRLNHIRLSGIALLHKRIRHPWHRKMGVALTPPIACRSNIH